MDPIEALLHHADPVERALALKMAGVQPHHIAIAEQDPHPYVQGALLAHKRRQLNGLSREDLRQLGQLLSANGFDIATHPHEVAAHHAAYVNDPKVRERVHATLGLDTLGARHFHTFMSRLAPRLEAGEERLIKADRDYPKQIDTRPGKVNFKLGVGKLRAGRDHIESTGKESLPFKEMPPGDWVAGRDRSTNHVTTGKLQHAIDSAPSHEWHFSTGHYGEDLSQKECNTCDGRGHVETETECSNCDGQGHEPITRRSAQEYIDSLDLNCTHCSGEGEIQPEDADGKPEGSPEECENCKGTGRDVRHCSNCEGTGTRHGYDCHACAGTGIDIPEHECEECEGRGTVEQESECDDCGGDGVVDNDPDEDDLLGQQTHSTEPSQVFRLDLADHHLAKLREAGLMDTFDRMLEASRYSAHPVNGPGARPTLGWIRYTGSPDGGLHVDEVQSDFGQKWSKVADGQIQTKAEQQFGPHRLLTPERLAGFQEAAAMLHPDSLAEPLTAEVLEKRRRDFATQQLASTHKWTAAGVMAHPERYPAYVAEENKAALDAARAEAHQAFPDSMLGKPEATPEELQARRAKEIDDRISSHDLFRTDEQRLRARAQWIEGTKAEFERQYPAAHLQQIESLLWGKNHPNELISEGFMQWLRDQGLHDTTIHWPSEEFKGPISLGDYGSKPNPAHFQFSYRKLPRDKWGFQPAKYGDLPTQYTRYFRGKPMWEGKVRKSEDQLPEAHEFYRRQIHDRDSHETKLSKLRSLGPNDDMWVFHATDQSTADKFVTEGVHQNERPENLAMLNYEAGRPAEYAPGRGLARGSYVGATPFAVEGYGKHILAFKVKPHQIAPSPEQESLGYKTWHEALANNDAVVMHDLPAENVFRLGGRRTMMPADTHTELSMHLGAAK